MIDINLLQSLNNNNLAISTLKRYLSSLKQLSKIFNINDISDLKYYISNFDDVIDYFNKNISNKAIIITNISSILYVLRYFIINKSLIDENLLNNVILKYQNQIKLNRNKIDVIKENIKNDKEEENWMSYKDLTDIYNKYNHKYIDIIKSKNKVPIEEYYNIQNMVILSFYILIEPVRSSEIATLKYKNFNVDTDNYIDIKLKKLVFNQFKTSKTYKKLVIDLSNNIELIYLIKSFILFKNKNNFNKDYLFNSNDDTILDNSQIAKRLNKIIGKNISSSMIRKIYLSDTYGDSLKSINNMKTTSKNMMNSTNVIMSNYIKK